MTTPVRSAQQPTVGSTERSGGLLRRLADGLRDVLTLNKQGVLRPMRPDKLLRAGLAYRRWGLTLPLGYAIGAVRHPDRPALIDERGALSFADVELRTTRLGHGLRQQGVTSGDRVGIRCRNHHGLVETMIACGKIGVDVVLLNTGLGTEQLNDVLAAQRVSLLVCDEEFADERIDDVIIVRAWTEGTTRELTLEHLVTNSDSKTLPRPPRHSRVIVLTSGTTGTPKGARRPNPSGIGPAATMMSQIPLRAGERILVCAPLFHTWGLAALQLGTVLGATLVLRRKFDPTHALAAVKRHRCTSIFAVPIMLQRIRELPAKERTSFDLSSLRIVACSGSALPSDLAVWFQHTFGAVLYNVYGSTEVSWVSIATPCDLRQAPETVGRPPRGTALRIVDDAGKPVRPGRNGRIFAGNEMLFDGYTNGGAREVLNGLMSTGDLGCLDHAGRLFVVGREDDMIISGGENIYPKETEDAIRAVDGVADVAVIGVDDTEFGQQLAAFVVPQERDALDAQQIREEIRGKLPKFAVPRDVVLLDELPRNATGKVVPRDLHHYIEESR